MKTLLLCLLVATLGAGNKHPELMKEISPKPIYSQSEAQAQRLADTSHWDYSKYLTPKSHPIGYAVKCGHYNADPNYGKGIVIDTTLTPIDQWPIRCETTWFKVDIEALIDNLKMSPRFEGFVMKMVEGVPRSDWPKGATHYTIYCSGRRCDTLWTYPIRVDTIVRCTTVTVYEWSQWGYPEPNAGDSVLFPFHRTKCDTVLRRVGP